MKNFAIANVAILTGILTVGFGIMSAIVCLIAKFYHPTIHIAF